MTHDPLCPMLRPCEYPAHDAMRRCDICGRACQCSLIAKVEARATPNHFRERIERLIEKANRWRDENAELRKQLRGQE